MSDKKLECRQRVTASCGQGRKAKEADETGGEFFLRNEANVSDGFKRRMEK